MTILNYRLLSQAVIRQKATRFIGNDRRQVISDAKRHGINREPILVESKTTMTAAYFPNEQTDAIVIELMEKRQAELATIAQAEQTKQPTALDNAYQALRTKLSQQGVQFKTGKSL